MHYPNLTSPKELMMLLKKHNFSCKKRLGQNFLIDQNILEIIIRVLEPQKDDHILEIGTGIGTLSAILSPLVKEVITIEKDIKLIPLIKENLSPFDNIEMIFSDAMDMDFYSFIKTYKKEGREIHKIVGNLPYYISIPLIRKVVELNKEIRTAVFLVQKEVGMRLMALPGEKDYGILSIAVQYYSKPQKIHHVPATVFYPKPKVNSMIIKLEVLKTPSIKVVNEKLFFEIVRASFQQRRKSIVNSLTNYFHKRFDKKEIEKILEKADIGREVRAENLYPEEFGVLANIMTEKMNL
jgi:16S rRNA (adenine1518-N6/adenine1519-N6)-dimethyltransferase